MSQQSVSTQARREELLRRRLSGRGGAGATEIARADRDRPLPLSYGQEQMWFIDQLNPGSTEYLVPVAFRLRGPLDVAVLGRAWDALVERHEILRTRHALVDGTPAQLVDEPATDQLPIVVLFGVPEVERERRARDLVAQDMAVPIDLGTQWPVRAKLVRLAADDHLLMITFHHIACDGWSTRILVAELGVLYGALVAGETPALPPLEVQYADFAVWQRAQLTGDVRERQLSYWRDVLAGIAPLDLPADRPRAAVRGYAGDEVDFVLPADLAERVRELGTRHDATPFVVLLTAFQATLARYTGRCDVPVGTIVSGRTRPELQRLIGYGVNTLVIRTRWSGEVSFTQLLGHVKEIVLDAFDHNAVPFAHVVDEVAPERDLSRTPLFQAVFTLHEAGGAGVEMAGVAVEPCAADGGIARCDLELQAVQARDGSFTARLIYATELFDRTTVERMARHLTSLLREAVADPDRPVSILDVLDDAERTALTEPASTVVATSSALARFHDQVLATPAAAAVVTEAGTTSFAELDGKANRLAHRLRQLGVGPESMVGLVLDRGADLIAAMLASWKAGGAYLPLGPELPEQRWAGLLADCGARCVLTEARYADRLASVFDGDVVVVDEALAANRVIPVADAHEVFDLDSLAYVIYTSGSTGQPKGVQVTHRGLINHLDWVLAEYVADWTGGAPLFSTVASDVVVPVLFGPLLAGQPVHVLPQDMDLSELGDRLARSAPFSFVKLTPGHLEMLSHQLDPETINGLAGTVVPGGDILLGHVARQWDELLGAGRVVNEYGPTEITVGNSTCPIAGEQDREVVPIGAPIPGTSMYVLDEWLRPVPLGVVGEVCVGGVGVARGYVNRAAQTADKFVPDPYGVPGARLYRTGDLGRVLADGTVDFVGRRDGQVKIRGYRVELGEIEGALRGHATVAETRVVLREDSPGDRRLVAYVVEAGPGGSDPEQLRSWLGQKLPEYMVPAAVVHLERIPLTANGKLDVAALPAPDTAELTDGYLAPRTAAEQRMADVWTEVLGVERVGVEDGFFDLGGDSIRAVALVGAMRVAGFDVSVRDVFAHRTVAALCDQLAELPELAEAETGVAPFELICATDRAKLPDGVVDAYPLSRNQLGMLFEMLADDQNRYHNVTSFRIRDDKPFSLAAMTEASRVVVARHEALRTSLHLAGYSVPMQLVHETAELSVGVRDITGVDAEEADRILKELSDRERADLFDLEVPGLLRFFVHLTGDGGYWISVTECHPILEGWGHHTLMMEFLDCYDRLRAGLEPRPHEAPAVRFADFVAEELTAIESPEHAGYWRGIVTDYVPFALPQEWGDDTVPVGEKHQASVTWRDLEDRLRARAADAGVSLKSVMVAAFTKVLGQLTEEPAFHVGLVCDARPERVGADKVYGMYLNTLPFAVRRGASTWRELVAGVFDREVELWPHRRFPFPEIARLAQGRQRLINVLFNYQDFNQMDTELFDDRAGADDSPTEFPLSVSSRVGMIFVTVDPRAVTPAQADRIAQMFRLVLESMAEDFDGDAAATYLPGGERERLLGWGTEPLKATAPGSVDEVTSTPAAIERQAAATPDAVAVECDDVRLTYAELDARANRLAHRLRDSGVGAGSVVGIVSTRDEHLLVSILATWKAGGAYVPLGPEVPPERWAYMLADVGARWVLAGPGVADRVPRSFGGELVLVDDDTVAAGGWPAVAPARTADPDELAYVIYTSGSTGQPKGVQVTHRGLANYLNWVVDDYAASGTGGAPLFSTSASDLVVTTLFGPLLCGQAVHVLPQDMDLSELGARLARSAPFSFVKLTPGHLEMLSHQLDAEELDGLATTLVVGGDVLHGHVAQRWDEALGGGRVLNEYGPTEVTVANSVFLAQGLQNREVVPIGKPVPGTSMYVLDEWLQPVPMGVVGEVCVGGTGVARGYVARPEQTADRFVPDPFGVPGSRLYRTGDLARVLADGSVDLIGRRDGQVKIRGYRVELGEIEGVLSGHPLVAEAKVTCHTGAADERRLVAYVVPVRDPETMESEQLRKWLAQALPDYMVPTSYVYLESFPLTANGKLDVRALPAPDEAIAVVAHVTPRTAEEQLVARVWSEVLGTDRIGVEHSFFDLGGDSIRAVALVGALRVAGFEVSVTDIFARRTVAGLCELITGQIAVPSQPH